MLGTDHSRSIARVVAVALSVLLAASGCISPREFFGGGRKSKRRPAAPSAPATPVPAPSPRPMVRGDLNGDGIPDLVMAAASHEAAGVDRGRVYVFFGGPGLLGTIASGTANVVIDGEANVDTFGVGLATGDVTGDGTEDLLVTAPFHDAGGADRGRVYVFAGGPGFAGVLAAGTASVARIDGEADGDALGFAGVASGDVTGDGTADLRVGAPFHDPPGGIDRGRIYVFEGGAGLSGVLSAGAASIARIDGEGNSDWLGGAGVAAADLTGDGTPDLLATSAYFETGAGSNRGRAYGIAGGAGLTGNLNAGAASFVRIDGEADDDHLGWGGVAAGDVTGDGLPDLLVAAPNHESPGASERGRVYVIPGGAGLAGTLDAGAASVARIDGEADLDGLGAGGLAALDVTGDGTPDVVATAPFNESGGGTNRGRAYVFAGGATLGSAGTVGAAAASLARIDGEVDGDRMGQANAGPVFGVDFALGVSALDVTGDGTADLVVAAPFDEVGGGSNRGRVYVLAGGPALAGNLNAGAASVARIDGEANDDKLSILAR